MNDEFSDDYIFDLRDQALLIAANQLLKKVAVAKSLRPAELVSVAKLQHVFSRLAKVTTELQVGLSVTGPRRTFGEIETHHWWGIEVEDERISLCSAGHFYRPSTGGDTFTTMTWSAVPGEPTEFNDYREHLLIVPDVQSFPEAVEAIEFVSGAYTVGIIDNDNALLKDLEEAEEDEEEPKTDTTGDVQEDQDTPEP